MPLVGAMLLILARTAQANGATACPATQPPVPAFIPPIPFSSAPFGEGNFLIGTNELWVSVPRQPWSGLRHKMCGWRPGFDGAKENHPRQGRRQARSRRTSRMVSWHGALYAVR